MRRSGKGSGGLTAAILFGGLLGGCAGPAGRAVQPAAVQGPGFDQPRPVPAIGRIDDDRDFDNSGGILLEIVEFPVTVTRDLIEWPMAEIAYLNGDTPGRAARMTVDANSADNRRIGLSKLVEYSFAHRPPYTTHFENMARGDPDPTVRAEALRACNRARDRAATPLFIAGLSDSSDLVRREAAKGLANLPDRDAVPALIRVVDNPEENRDVRIAAADALKYYRTPEVARSLASLVGDHDLAIAWQARRSLIYMTNRDFRYDPGVWLQYFAGTDRPAG